MSSSHIFKGSSAHSHTHSILVKFNSIDQVSSDPCWLYLCNSHFWINRFRVTHSDHCVETDRWLVGLELYFSHERRLVYLVSNKLIWFALQLLEYYFLSFIIIIILLDFYVVASVDIACSGVTCCDISFVSFLFIIYSTIYAVFFYLYNI